MTDGTELWDAVAASLDEYMSAFREGEEPPEIERFLPEGSRELRNLAIIELAKLQMEQFAGLGKEFGIDHYLNRFPELRECTGGAPLDLIIDEIRLRKLNASCDERAYLDRFPLHRESLKRYFSFSDTTPSATRSISWNRSQLEAGQVIDDYDLVRLLGSGAFAQVFLARQNTMQRLVALKVSADRGDEAKTLAQLDHPHIVRVFDVRRQTTMKLRLLSMQYAPGGTLQDVVQSAKHLPWSSLSGQVVVDAVDRQLLAAGLPPPEESPRRQRMAKLSWIETVCDIGIQIATALDYAHQQNVLHRDVKPANVLLTSEATCKLADFNISYSGDLHGANPSSYFGGSLIYMSPEQLEATQIHSEMKPSDLDERSDVFSLAFVLWELLTLERPWPRDEVQMDWNATVEHVSHRRKTLPPEISSRVATSKSLQRVIQVLLEALAVDREQRISSAGELASRLRLCLMPEAWSLFHPEKNFWTRLAVRYPLLSAAVIVFLPNGLAGGFNFFYNLAWMMEKSKESYQDFLGVSLLINVLAFSIGGLIFYAVHAPIVNELGARRMLRPQENSPALRSAFFAGHKAAFFGVTLWLIAGLAFPLLLSMRVKAFDYTSAVHFFLSLAVCGTIAASYPFLAMSWVAIECWYGVLIGKKLKDPGFEERADEVMRWCDRFLLAAAGVPLAGLLLLLGRNEVARIYLGLLVSASGLGLFFAFRVHQRLRDRMQLLRSLVADPSPT